MTIIWARTSEDVCVLVVAGLLAPAGGELIDRAASRARTTGTISS